MQPPITIRAEPLDVAARCRFTASTPVDPGRWTYVADRGDAAGSPLAERLFAVEGVEALVIAHDTVVVTRSGGADVPLIGPYLRMIRRTLGDRSARAVDWKAIGRGVGAAIRSHLASGAPAVSEALRAAMPSPEQLRNRVIRVLETQVNPVVADHGGGVELVDLIDNVVYVRMQGGCQGCGLADMTLKRGVEAALYESVPEIGAIHDLTNHAAGRAPYVQGKGSWVAGRRASTPFMP